MKEKFRNLGGEQSGTLSDETSLEENLAKKFGKNKSGTLSEQTSLNQQPESLEQLNQRIKICAEKVSKMISLGDKVESAELEEAKDELRRLTKLRGALMEMEK